MVALALVAAAMAPSSARAGDSRPHVIAITLDSEINPQVASHGGKVSLVDVTGILVFVYTAQVIMADVISKFAPK